MKIIQSLSFIRVIGIIWSGGKGFTEIDLSPKQVADLGDLTRESIAAYLKKNAGDFQAVTDFYADIESVKGETIIIPWALEDSEDIYLDSWS